jgi:hypothetical protein
MVSTLEIELIVFIVVLATVLAGAFLYLRRRLRERRSALLSELSDRPMLNQDRAFNRLTMARREADILVGQGVDVHRAQELIAEAQGAFDLRQFDRAYQSAQSAHEALVNARRQGTRSAARPLPSSGPGTPVPAPTAAVPSTAAASSTTSDRPAIPKDRAESQFQLRLLGEELEKRPAGRAKETAVTEASALRDQASAAFDRADYSTAFRLALRGRRTLGGTIETLPPPAASTHGVPGRTTAAGAAAPDPTSAAEAAAGGQRCPDCGYPSLSGDAFCRGCGRPRAPLTCPTCGEPRGAEEPFCGRCGNRFP